MEFIAGKFAGDNILFIASCRLLCFSLVVQEVIVNGFVFILSANEGFGFREGPKGTHTSRTIMIAEVERVLRSGVSGTDLERIVLEENLLEKATTSGRSLSLQRLRELYGLERSIPIFVVFSTLWNRDPDSLPLLAMLAALARDPLPTG